ncbi:MULTISPECIES: amino acid ABC transporter permease [Mesorhizobium]|uniref:Amino acid ABC transporter permease n=1 Tax=Mesorhizobium denitrificans TaxID=2294114 RepID=A0A371XJG0_9HYPH|nr:MULTISPECIES: amino acid ABC transporter permease [Mesorhizobium]RFC69194.1 amino acid ABC transporter permease [Mesorhizobium denitrificans]
MDPSILLQYWPLLLGGFKLTILCWVLGTIFSMVLGLFISLAQRYGPRPLGWLIQAYIEVIRGTPFLVQLFVLYYGGPLLGLRLDALPAGLLGLSIYGSPYFAEIFRAGYLAVPVGQLEAARAIGMSEPTIVRRILLPLSLVSALPALVNFSIILTKETVILSIITVPELMYSVQRMSTETFRYLEANFVLALFFWALVEVISRAGRLLETRVTKHLIERT